MKIFPPRPPRTAALQQPVPNLILTTISQKLLKELRHTPEPAPDGILGFPRIDKLLELFRYHGRHSPTRRSGWTATPYGGFSSDNEDDEYESTHLDQAARRPARLKHQAAIVEVFSTVSAAGKTTLLYHLTAVALLPHEYGGKGSAVLWLDTDNSFSAFRIAQVMSHAMNKTKSKTTRSIDDIVTSAIQHLYILTPTSSTSLLQALISVPDYVRTHTSHTSPNRPLSLLVLDSATAFTHQDRFDADIARLEAGPNIDTSHSNAPSRTSQTITALRQIQQDFECTIIFTTTQHTAKSRPRPTQRPNQKPHQTIPAEPPSQTPWTSFATLTIHISRIPNPQFAPNMTLEECLRDREKRQESVLKGRFAVDLNWEGSDMWPVSVRDAVGEMERRGGFVVRITEKGLDVE